MSKKTKSHSPLRNWRRARTLSQAELAQLVGMSQQMIAKAERGQVALRPDIQERIAVILGVSRGELFPEPESAVAP